MTKIARIGIDTSKSVFQLHGVDEAEQVVLQRKLRRRGPKEHDQDSERSWSSAVR